MAEPGSSGDAFGAGLSAVALAALSRAVREATHRVEQLTRNLVRANAATSRVPTATPAGAASQGGHSSASPGRSGGEDARIIAQAMASHSAKLTAMVAAIERNTQALRQVATLSGVSAATGVVRTVQAAASAPGRSPVRVVSQITADGESADTQAPGSVRRQRKPLTQEQKAARNKKAREKRAAEKDAAVQKEASKIQGVPLERPDEPVPNVPLEKDGNTPTDPKLLALAHQSIWDEQDRNKSDRRAREDRELAEKRRKEDIANQGSWKGLTADERAEKEAEIAAARKKFDAARAAGRKGADTREANRRAATLKQQLQPGELAALEETPETPTPATPETTTPETQPLVPVVPTEEGTGTLQKDETIDLAAPPEVTEPYPTPPGHKVRRKPGGGPVTPSEEVPLTPLEQGPAQASEVVTYPQATGVDYPLATEVVAYPQAVPTTENASPAPVDISAIEAEMAAAEAEFAANEERLRQQREKKGAGTERGQQQAARNAERRQAAHNERLAEMRARMEAAQQAAASQTPPEAIPVPQPAAALPIEPPPAGIPIEPPPAGVPIPGPVNVLPPPDAPPRSVPIGRVPPRVVPYQPAIPTAGNLPSVPVPGGLPPIARPPTTPPGSLPPLLPPPGGPPGGGAAGGGPPGVGASGGELGGSIPELIAALKANTDATLENSKAMAQKIAASGNTSALATTAAQAGAQAGAKASPTAATGWTGFFQRLGQQFQQIGKKISAGYSWTLGKMDAGQDRLQNFSGATGASAGAGAAGVLGLVSAISPSAISTLTGSFQMLAGEIGKSFVPAVYDAAYGLQDLARWVGGLDEGMKSGLARIAVFTVGGLGALSVASRVLAGSIGLVTGAVRVLGTALLFLTANPIGITITAVAGLGALLLTVTGQWENFGNAASRALGLVANKAGDAVRVVGQLGQAVKEESTAELTEKLPADIRSRVLDQRLTPEKRQEVVSQEIAKIQDQIKAERKETPQEIQFETAQAQKRHDIIAPEAAYLRKFYQEQLDDYRRSSKQPDIDALPARTKQYNAVIEEQNRVMQNVTRAGAEIGAKFSLEELAPIMQAIKMVKVEGLGLFGQSEKVRGLAQFQTMPPKPKVPLPSDERVKVLQQTIDNIQAVGKAIGVNAADKKYLENFSSPIQSRYTDAMSFRDSVQLAALNVGDLDAANKQKQMEEYFKRNGDQGEKIVDALQEANKLLAEIKGLPFLFGRHR